MNKLLNYNCFLNEYLKVINLFDEKYILFQNPKLTDNLNENIRFLSDKYGNLFCIKEKTNYVRLTHSIILELLQENNIDVINPYTKEGYNNTISWQRYENTNRIYLGESYLKQLSELNINIIEKCAKQNPNWIFYKLKINIAKDNFEDDEPYKINI